jgi:Bacterial cellulose synthase subunit
MGEMEITGDAMNWRRAYHVLLCLSILTVLLVPQQTVSAQDLNAVDIPLEVFHDQQPIELHGLISSQTLNIPIPQSWLIGDENWLELQFRASPLLDSGRSSLSLSINDFQIGSYRLETLIKTKQRIPVLSKMFTQGNNILTISGALYLPDDLQTNCENWDDPVRWLAVEPGGLLHLSFNRRELQADLSNFPQILIEPLEKYLPDQPRKQTLIVLPEESTQDDLTSVASLSYILGNAANSNYDWQPEIVKTSQLTPSLRADRNIVFIGEVPAEFQDRASNDKDQIALFPSPWGVGHAVMIIGDANRQDGFSPATILSDRARSILLRGNVAYIDQLPPPPSEPFQNSVTFEDLGYLDRTVRGIGQQNLIYRMYIPYDVEPLAIKLHLGLVYSPGLDIQNSSFSIYLNGYSVAGILPSNGTSSGEPIAIGLPARNFRRGLNFIRVGFDLHVPHSTCERGLESVWATVLKNSTLETTYRNNAPVPSLKNFPLPFSDEAGFAFVIPDQFSPKDLLNVSRLSFLIGTAAYRPNRPPKVMAATDFSKKGVEAPNIILVGLPAENSVTQSTNSLLPQPFTEEGNSLEEGYGVYLPTSDQDASLGLMQIIPSPWAKNGVALILTGNDQQGLDWTWDVILNPTLQNQFSGNVMVVGPAQRSQALGALSAPESPQALFQKVADASNIPIVGPLLQKYGPDFLGPAGVAIASALLLTVLVLWVSRVIRNRKNPILVRKEDETEEHE